MRHGRNQLLAQRRMLVEEERPSHVQRHVFAVVELVKSIQIEGGHINSQVLQ